MVSLKDIAKIAGVNISTVSRALNDSVEIGEETKKRIKKIANQYNYIPDYTAKALAGKGTKSIGVIVPEIGSNYFATMLNYIEHELDKRKYSLLVGMAHHNYKKEIYYLNVFRNRRVDAIILAGSMYKEIVSTLDKIREKQNIPIVLIHTFVPFKNYDYISVDDFHGINSAVRFLKKQGHRKIGYIADELASRFRIDIILEAIKKHGLELNQNHIIIGNEPNEYGGYLLMKKMLKEKELPTAILASYDYIAIGAIKALLESGLRVPDDISIVGYDNIRESAYLHCPLTTISPPLIKMVELSINILINKIENKRFTDIQHFSLKPELIIRESTLDLTIRSS